MIGHIVLAILATWLTLALLVHAALFAVGTLAGTDGPTFKTLSALGATLIAPVAYPLWFIWRQRLMRRSMYMARYILASLPEDERDAFMVRLRSGNDRKQTILDALARIREQREAAR